MYIHRLPQQAMMKAVLTRSSLTRRSLLKPVPRTSFSSVGKTAAVSPEKSSSSESVPIGATLAAAGAASAFVSMVAAAVELSTAEDVPVFDPKGQRFSQVDFQGRFARMLLACDPRLLFYSPAQVEQAKALVEDAAKFKDDRNMDRTLWEARRVVDAALHPDTGDTIPHPFRMSGYVPGNGKLIQNCHCSFFHLFLCR
jgi:hypothetical protein